MSPVDNYDLERLIAAGSMPASARMYAEGVPVQSPGSAMGLGPGADAGMTNGIASLNMNGGHQGMVSH